jgi:hypothetical protein
MIKNKMLSQVRGGYLGLAWQLFNQQGEPTDRMEPNGYIVAENYYGYVFLRINADNTLTECEVEEDD